MKSIDEKEQKESKEHEVPLLTPMDLSAVVDDKSNMLESQNSTEKQSIEKNGWLSLGAGFILALLMLLLLPCAVHIFSYFTILVHEFGHALSGWIFGYLSIPAFDFKYGGGITAAQTRSTLLLVAVYGLFVAGFYFYRKNRPSLIFLSITVLIYSVVAFTPVHEIIILFMGHGMELVFAGIFLYRAASGSAVINPLERPLYAVIGFFMEFSDIRFAYRLFASPRHRAEYAAAKGGGHWMDFSRIARDYLHVDLSTVALLFLVCCFLPPVVSFLVHRYRNRIVPFVITLARREKPQA